MTTGAGDCEFCEIDGYGNHAPRCPVQLEAELKVARRTVAFFASCIKSGEPWSAECEQARLEAMGDEPRAPAICVCGHAMADHIEGFDPCSRCECQQFREAGGTSPRG